MVTFYLITPRRERSAIFISIGFKGKQYRRTTKESTLVKYWNPQKRRVGYVERIGKRIARMKYLICGRMQHRN